MLLLVYLLVNYLSKLGNTANLNQGELTSRILEMSRKMQEEARASDDSSSMVQSTFLQLSARKPLLIATPSSPNQSSGSPSSAASGNQVTIDFSNINSLDRLPVISPSTGIV